MSKPIEILGVKIDPLLEAELDQKLIKLLESKKKQQIVTINSEFLVLAHDNPDFKQLLNNANLRIADGVGILIAAKFLKSKITKNTILRPIAAFLKLFSLVLVAFFKPRKIRGPIPERISGVDLSYKLVQLAQTNQFKIFLLGAGVGVSEKAALKLQTDYLELKVSGSYSGSPKMEDEQKIIEMVNKNKTDILFVAFGAPKQDFWINRNLKHLKIKIAVGVGGTLDFMSGDLKRAPFWFQKHSLEWLYRLWTQPKRFIRSFSIWKFLYLIYRDYLDSHSKSA